MSLLLFLYKVTYLVTLVGACIIGIYVLSRGWNKRFNQMWAFLHVSVAVWSLGRYMILVAPDHATALFWCRILMFGSLFIYPSFLHAVLVLFGRRQKIVYLFYGIATVLFICNVHDLMVGTTYLVKDVRPKLSFAFYDEPNTLWNLHLFSTTVCPLIAVVEMVRAYKKSNRETRNRIKFVLLATIVGIVGGSTNVPLIYNIQIEPIGTPLVPIYLFLISYAIYKYRLMEINYFLYRGLSYAFLSALFVVPSLIIIWLVLNTRGAGTTSVVAIACVLVLGVVLLPKFKHWTETTISKTFMKDWLRYEEISREFVTLITSTIDLGQLASGIVALIGGKLGTHSSSLYILDQEKNWYVRFRHTNAPTNGPESLAADSALIAHLQEVKDVVVREELERTDGSSEVVETMRELGAEASVPFRSKEKLIAVLNLGPKRNGRFFNMEEVDLLRNIGGQGAVALENAIAFKTIEALNVGLEQKVRERTRQLEEALNDLKETQVQLVHSEKMASIGVLTAGMAHELYNPLTACLSSISVLGRNLSALRNGTATFEQVGEKCVRAVERVQNSMKRMEGIITSLKRFSRKDVEGIKLNDIHQGLESTLDLVRDRLSKDIRIHTEFGCSELVECDLGQINQVFLNLLQNAIQALEGKGGDIWISTRSCNGKVEVVFKDNASGIPEDVLGRIFEPFFTTKEVGKGTGLGLSISQRIVRDHGGDITVKSILGEGSEFIVSLPLRQAKAA